MACRPARCWCRQRGNGGARLRAAAGAVDGLRDEALLAIGQANGDEPRLVAAVTQPLHRRLRQHAGGGRIDAAADAEHIGAQAGGFQIVGQEGDAPLGLGCGVEGGGNAKCVDDGGLNGGHGLAHLFETTPPPPQAWRDMLQDRLDDMGVVVDAELVRHGEQQRVGLGDRPRPPAAARSACRARRRSERPKTARFSGSM